VKHTSAWLYRAAAVVLIPAQVLLAVPVAAAEPATPREAAKADPPRVVVNKTAPRVTPPPLLPEFSPLPPDQEIFRARVFDEPLVPVADDVSLAENRALADALLAYLKTGGADDVSAVVRFLDERPSSRWSASIWTGLGVVYRRTGYYSRALEAWERAWILAKDRTEPGPKAIADRAVAELAELNARLGRFDRLERLFAEIEGRNIGGAAAEKISGARSGYWQMLNTPDKAFRCGPLSLDRILAATRSTGYRMDPLIFDSRSTQRGTSLLQMRDLSRKVGLNLQMARRASPTADPLVPSMVHWRAAHFAAMVRSENGRYLLQDPTFGGETWVTRTAIDEESSGSFLVPEGPLPPGWKAMTDEEGDQVWGKGATTVNNPQNYKPEDPKVPKNCPRQPMAAYSIHLMLVSLQVSDTPIHYSPPVGPEISFTLRYNQREVFQPQTPYYGNFGPKWTYDWLGYVEDNPANLSDKVNVYIRGGGQETYDHFDATSQSYPPHMESHATVVRSTISPIKYRRRLSDGSVEIYGQPDGSTNFPRRVFLTALKDPQGNQVNFTYDQYFRLVGVSDVIGQITTLTYDPSDYLKITRITDPFGRSATFEYNSIGQLYRITDPIGIQSSFTYAAGDFLSSLTTPYGTTTFSAGEAGVQRWIDITDPLGAKERVEFRHNAPGINYNDSAGTPSWPGMTLQFENNYLQYRNTFYWDKRASAMYPGDYTKAEITHWLHVDANVASGIIESTKQPLENRVWYLYPGQWSSVFLGASGLPSAVARVLDDGATQVYQYEYNSLGKVTRETDPVGRAKTYTYDTNGIDLLEVRYVNGPNTELLQSFTYNAQHRPLTITDAAGNTTTYTYNTAGQVLTVTTPPRAGITENRTTTFTYDANGFLQNAVGPAAGATVSLAYDGYGDVRTWTDQSGHTLTYDYDALDRTTKITHPDGTYEETVYNRLDAEKRRDRLGRWTHTFHDALRRPVSIRDPLGRTTTQQWCTCGSLDKAIDGNNDATTWERDLQGRITKETRADASFTQFVYENTTSRLKQRIDRKNQTATYSYFLDDTLQQTTYTNAQNPTATVSYTYDPVYPRKATMTDGTGTTTWTYNPITTTPSLGAGLLASVSGPVGSSTYTTTFTYDERGRVTRRSIDGTAATASYDVLGRVSGETDPLGAVNYTFVGATGRLSSVSLPNGQTTSFLYFDNLGDNRLQEIKHLDPGAAILSKFNYIYDAVGNIKTWSQQAGANPAKVYAFDYDGARQLTRAVISGVTPLPVPSRFGYSYDNAGNRTAEQLDDAVTGATYDNVNHLVSTQAGGALVFRGSVNEPATVTVGGKPAQVAGDNTFQGTAAVPPGTSNVVIAATDPSGNTRTNTYQLSQSGTPKTLNYDLDGNLTNDGTRTYEWDAENRLVAVNQGTNRSEFTYDGLGQRVRIVEKVNGTPTSDKRYVWCGIKPCQERDASGATVTKAFYRHGIMDGSTKYFTTLDHLGSTREITNNSGAVVARYGFDPYGRMTKVSGTYDTVFGFTGHYHHAPSGLALPLYRAYAADLGQWTSEDPASFADGMNLYRYVQGNPVAFVDPTGEMTAMQGACLTGVLLLLTATVVVVTVTTAGAGTVAMSAAAAAGTSAAAGAGTVSILLFCAPPPPLCMPRQPKKPGCYCKCFGLGLGPNPEGRVDNPAACKAICDAKGMCYECK